MVEVHLEHAIAVMFILFIAMVEHLNINTQYCRESKEILLIRIKWDL